jgi:hypothetical protein
MTDRQLRQLDRDIRLIIVGLVVGLLLTGCAYQTGARRAEGAPVLPASPYAEVLRDTAPAGAVVLGTVRAQGNNWQSPAACEAQLVNEARKLGANAVLTTPATSTWGRGPSCLGTAYLLKKRP